MTAPAGPNPPPPGQWHPPQPAGPYAPAAGPYTPAAGQSAPPTKPGRLVAAGALTLLLGLGLLAGAIGLFVFRSRAADGGAGRVADTIQIVAILGLVFSLLVLLAGLLAITGVTRVLVFVAVGPVLLVAAGLFVVYLIGGPTTTRDVILTIAYAAGTVVGVLAIVLATGAQIGGYLAYRHQLRAQRAALTPR